MKEIDTPVQEADTVVIDKSTQESTQVVEILTIEFFKLNITKFLNIPFVKTEFTVGSSKS